MKFAFALLALASGGTALKLPIIQQRSRVRTVRVRAPVQPASNRRLCALPVGDTPRHSRASNRR